MAQLVLPKVPKIVKGVDVAVDHGELAVHSGEFVVLAGCPAVASRHRYAPSDRGDGARRSASRCSCRRSRGTRGAAG